MYDVEVPPELGTINAYTYDWVQLKNINKIEIKNCTKVLSQETISASHSAEINFATDHYTYCLDPHNMELNEFYDGIGGNSQPIRVSFDACQHKPTVNTCMTLEE